MITKKILTIDPSGTGTTGICLVNFPLILFREYQSKNWEEHLKYIVEIVREWKPNIIIYETTNYIHKRLPGSLSLLKLIGSIVSLKYIFAFLQEVNSIAVNQVKPFKNKLFKGEEEIEKLTCQTGRGKGWKYQDKRISLHQLDALVVYHLWSERSLESKKSLRRKVTELRRKKRLGSRQKEQLEKLEKLLAKV